MKSTIRKRTYQAIYRLLDRVSPLPFDCGSLCDAACCVPKKQDHRTGKEQEPEQENEIEMKMENEIETKRETETETETGYEWENETDLGIYLLPGEEKMFDRREPWLVWTAQQAEDFDFPVSWRGKVYFIRCLEPPHCPRSKRPLQCRFFPLSPHLTADGILRLIRCPDPLPYRCPLIAGQMTLNDDFIRATYTVWKHLLRDPLIYDLVEMDSADRRQEGTEPDYVW